MALDGRFQTPVGATVREVVQDYYGKRVKTSEDLMTDCCTMDLETFSKEAREARKLIHPEVLSKYIVHAGKWVVIVFASMGMQACGMGTCKLEPVGPRRIKEFTSHLYLHTCTRTLVHSPHSCACMTTS